MRVVDGDTLIARSGGSRLNIRLACVDAPELKQEFGERSRSRLQQLTPEKSQVRVLVVDTDRYGRQVGVVFGNGQDFNVNLQMVKEGYAAVYQQYLRNCPGSREELISAEREAKINRRMMWSQTNPCLPWDFRAGSCSSVADELDQRNCDPNYAGACIPPYPPDINCSQISARRFSSTGSDPHNLDRDGDGVACEN